MARIRTIKPEFWTSEPVSNCSIFARLLFIGMWTFCDDGGNHQYSLKRLKMEVFPGDNFSIEQIDEWFTELIKNDLIKTYTIDSIKYFHVRGWHHQRIDRPNYFYPKPDKFDDNSTTTRRQLDERSSTESSLVESSLVDHNIDTSTSSTTSSPKNSESILINEIFEFWKSTLNHPKAKLDAKRKRKIKAALSLGYSKESLCDAIAGCCITPFNMGDNEGGKRYDDIELILRDSSHIERFINNLKNPEFIRQSKKDKLRLKNVQVANNVLQENHDNRCAVDSKLLIEKAAGNRDDN